MLSFSKFQILINTFNFCRTVQLVILLNRTINLLLYLGIEVTFEVKSKTLVMGTAIPGSFKGSLVGLLGNFDGISSNDFILPNGTVLKNKLLREGNLLQLWSTL